MTFVLTSILLGAMVVQASPALFLRQLISTLTTAQIDGFSIYTHYASAAYCTPEQTMAWNCGANCKANSDFEPVDSGSDGIFTQYWYVRYNCDLDMVIVAHQGTDPATIVPLIRDADVFLENLDSTLFPGISSEIECHSGFTNEQARTATAVLAAVKKTMALHSGTTSVTMVGHSLGGAITLLDSVYLPLWLPARTTFRTICYGLPHVGNQAFADYVDANLHLTHINNREDPVPMTPGTFLGYHHPAGEIHIQDSGDWVACPGQDNPSTQCIIGDIPYLWDGHVADHDGPYDGIEMGC